MFEYGSYDIPYSFAGMRVHEISAKYEPILQLSKDFKWVSDEFRAKQNRYLLEKFGTRDISRMPIDQVLMFGDSIIARPETASILSGMLV